MAQALLAVLRGSLARALRGGALGEAEELLARLKHEDPLSLPTLGLELELLLRAGRLDEADALAAQLLALHPASARVAFLAGRVAYRRREYDRARELLAESLRLYPHWSTRLWLAKSLTQLGQLAVAEPLLVEVAQEHPRALRDLAWLYERMGESARALSTVESYLARFGEDELAAAQRQRLRAQAMDAAALHQEVEALVELGEGIPGEVLPEYVKRLLDAGEVERARAAAIAHAAGLDERAATRLAWVCHRARLSDLACELFFRVFSLHRGNPKFLAALEADAARCDRLDRLLELYRAHAPDDPRLYGRARALRRRLGPAQS